MKIFRENVIAVAFKCVFVALLVLSVLASCKKDSVEKDDEEEQDTLGGVQNFIPKEGFIYAYKFTSEDGENSTVFKGNLGSKDSIGIKVSEIKNTFTHEGETITIKNKMYDLGGFTITTIYQAQEWEKYIAKLRESIEESGGTVLELTLGGIPFNMLMDNTPVVGSDLQFTGGPTTFDFKARVGTGDQAVILKTKQTITRHNGKAVRQEEIETEAGKYNCTVWKYQVDNKVETFLNGNIVNTLNSSDDITVWTSPGIGEVLVVTENSTSGTSTLELITISR